MIRAAKTALKTYHWTTTAKPENGQLVVRAARYHRYRSYTRFTEPTRTSSDLRVNDTTEIKATRTEPLKDKVVV